MKNSHIEARKIEEAEAQTRMLEQINARLSRIEASLGIGEKSAKKPAANAAKGKGAPVEPTPPSDPALDQA
jgi:hypothetical protein